MESTVFRFSRIRWLGPVAVEEFKNTVDAALRIVKRHREYSYVELRTCNDKILYDYSMKSATNEAIEALNHRDYHILSGFNANVWSRMLRADAYIKDESDDSLLLTLTCDRHALPKQIVFHGHAVYETMRDRIKNAFGRRNLTYTIDDGRTKPFRFNHDFGQRLTGLKLR